MIKKSSDIAERISANEKMMRELSLKIATLSKTVEDYKKMQDKSIKLIYTWAAFSIALMLASLVMTQIGVSILKAIEVGSSWAACAFLIYGGIYAAKLTYHIDKIVGFTIAASWALISTCYIGYVLFNFGSLHPEAGAIGFNIGASAQTFALIRLASVLKRNG
jgi:hypothetical protein